MIKPEKVEDIIINAPCGTIPPPPPPTVKWGKIKGNINNQKDLKNALDQKANVSSVEANTDSIKTLSTNLNNTIDSVDTLETTIDTLETAVATKQDTLVSGTNIKTINNNSILGSGNLSISGGSSNVYSYQEEVVGTWLTGKPLYRVVKIHSFNSYGDFNFDYSANYNVVMYQTFYNGGSLIVEDNYENSVRSFVDNGAHHYNFKITSSPYNSGWAKNAMIILYYTKNND